MGRFPFTADHIETQSSRCYFIWEDGRPILHSFNLILRGDKKYALVGENGVGKTTIVKLLTGFYQQYEGQILINGRDVRTIRREDLRRLFSVVYQNYAKYETSFEQNLLPNAVGERREEVKTVLEATGLASVVKRLNKGIETPLGKLDPEGVDVSGGEWQLLAIARGLLKDACIYVLD